MGIGSRVDGRAASFEAAAAMGAGRAGCNHRQATARAHVDSHVWLRRWLTDVHALQRDTE